MDLRVSISYEQDVEINERITLTATVTHRDTGAVVTDPDLEYSWSLSDTVGELIAPTDEASVEYYANVTDSTSVDVTCSVSLAGDSPPTAVASVTLSALSGLGVDGIVINILFTTALSGDDLYDNSIATPFMAGSDAELAPDLSIGRIRYLSTNRRLLINRTADSTGTMSSYWDVNNATKVVYILFDDGTIGEFEPAWYSNSGMGFVNFVIPDTTETQSLRDKLDAIVSGQTILIGVADTDTIDNEIDTGSETVRVNIIDVPDQVTGVSVRGVAGSHTSLSVSWDVPPTLNNNGATIDRYEIRYVDMSNAELTTEVTLESTSNAILRGLSQGEVYTVQVRAHNSVGWGSYSAVVSRATTEPSTPIVAGTGYIVRIEHESNVERDGSVVLTATVIDTSTGEATTEMVSYSWSFVGTGTGAVDPTNPNIYTYNAEGFDVDDVPASVQITCSVIVSGLTPSAGAISLSTLIDLGVDSVEVNMLMQANVDGDYLYNGENDSVEPGSDTNLADATDEILNINQILWRITATGDYELVLNRDPLDDKTMTDYWITDDNVATKSVYIITPDGSVLEIKQRTGIIAVSATTGTVVFTLSGSESDIQDIITKLNAIVSGQTFVLGVGDSDTITGITVAAKLTVSVAVLGDLAVSTSLFNRTFIRPIRDKINASFLNRIFGNTAFNKLEGITNKPRAAYGIAAFTLVFNDYDYQGQSVAPFILVQDTDALGNPVGPSRYDPNTNYDPNVGVQRYKTTKELVNLNTRINGVDEFTTTNYVVILQDITDRTVGSDGRSLATMGVYGKTTTSFNIAYEEGITYEAFDTLNNGQDGNTVHVRIAWMARGW